MLDFILYSLIGSTPSFLYFDLYLNTAYAAHYVNLTVWAYASSAKNKNRFFNVFCFTYRIWQLFYCGFYRSRNFYLCGDEINKKESTRYRNCSSSHYYFGDTAVRMQSVAGVAAPVTPATLACVVPNLFSKLVWHVQDHGWRLDQTKCRIPVQVSFGLSSTQVKMQFITRCPGMYLLSTRTNPGFLHVRFTNSFELADRNQFPCFEILGCEQAILK